jgi:hypothetical protein
VTPRADLSKRPTRAVWLALAAAALAATASLAQTTARTPAPAVASGAEQGLRWQDLKPAQRTTLKPLEHQWSSIDAPRKQKWVELAARYPNMPSAEQARISERMTAWAKLSPAERGQARLNFQEARQMTPHERLARWEAYQALPADERRQLAARAAPAPATARASESTQKPALRESGAQAKSNIVPNPAYAARPKPVAPTVVQARPGVTTSLVSQRAAPPSHQQPGLPKIAGSPGFVDKATLLPQRGPQGAATNPAEAKAASADRAPAR